MATGSIMPFRPTGTVSLAAGTNSASVALAGGGDSVVVTNITTSLAYVRFGADPSVAATVADMPVLAGSRVMLGVNSLIEYAAAVLVSGSGNVLLTRGDGSYL
jgi:H2-forming N5,N10-methylenetetrahydromethanopterin dehydrogenase-like enzyme